MSPTTTPAPANDPNVVQTIATQTASGHQVCNVTLTRDADKRTKELLCDSPYVIPVIFVPGVMGTNLKKKNSSRVKVWRPPNGTPDGIKTLAEYFFKKAPADRQILFDPKNAEVDKDGPINPGATGLSAVVLKERGWGSVHMDSYGEILRTLHHTLNNLYTQSGPVGAAPTDEFMYHMLEDPALWGSVSRSTKLTKADLKAMGCYRAVPDSGRERVLGVIHGVQPSVGAPSAYTRMRAGFEGVLGGVLGVNAIEAVPELANSPAALEMLPFATYNDGKPWLSTSNPKHLSLPKTGNPFAEIYACAAWYGLIPEQNTKLIDPAGTVAKRIGPDKSIRENFTDALVDARSFQNAITNYGYHPQTHVYCCVEQTRKTWGQVCWNGHIRSDVRDIKSCVMSEDSLTGSIRLAIGAPLNPLAPKWDSVAHATLALSSPDQAGDGTVYGIVQLTKLADWAA